MIIKRIEGYTRVLNAPPNWNGQLDGVCGALPIADTIINRSHFMVSAWEPTPEELALLNAGANIYLFVSAPQHPVVALSVGPIPAEQTGQGEAPKEAA